MTNSVQKLIIAVVFSNYGSGSLNVEMNKCRQHDIQSLLSQRDDDNHKCQPRKVTVELNTRDTWPGHALLAPTHLEVARCVGSCGHYFHSCYPTSTRSILVPVILSEITVREGVTDTTCGHVEIKEHLACGCGCDVAEETCTDNQMFLQFEFRCVCYNHNKRDACLSRGWRWDRDSCSCQCPGAPYPTCSSGYLGLGTWDLGLGTWDLGPGNRIENRNHVILVSAQGPNPSFFLFFGDFYLTWGPVWTRAWTRPWTRA